MSISEKVFNKHNFSTFIYPVFIVIAIPSLLIINTLWNLKSFNRDANFIIRHNASSLADSIKPQIAKEIDNPAELESLLNSNLTNNADFLSLSVLSKNPATDSSTATGTGFQVISTTNHNADQTELYDETLNNFTLSTGNSYAGLSYSPALRKNVWKVSVPLNQDNKYILTVVMSTDTVNQILNRTSKDSLILLSITLIVAVALLINHLIFYKRSLRAQQLEEIDRLKDEFISMASHELRAPVTGLVGYLELLGDKFKDKMAPDVKEDFLTLGRLTENLQKLINDLLEVSRIDQGRIKITKSQCDPNKLISDVVTQFTPMANQKGLYLKYTTSSLPAISTDPERFSQVLTNLVSNAIKYTLKGGVELTATSEKNRISICVKDSGIGIPPEEMQKLFGKFHRVKDEKTREVNGTGLGLWITKQLADALSGKIEVQSIYNTGSTFTFSLPVG